MPINDTSSMTTTAVSATPSTLRLAAPPEQRLALSELDKLAVTAFTTGDPTDLLEQVRARAEALCGHESDAAVARLLGRRIASTEATVELLEAMVVKAVAERDLEALPHIERMQQTYSTRLVRLLESRALYAVATEVRHGAVRG